MRPGLNHLPGFIDRDVQRELVDALRAVVSEAPFFTPVMPRTGRPLSVAMTNCGALGWISDRAGYRYQATHPATGRSWPPIPPMLLEIWREIAEYPAPPEAVLINYYGPGARMGLHQDRDEADLAAPVLSLSLGDACRFRLGGTRRADPVRTLRLASGDALILAGGDRLAFHGVARIEAGTSTLLAEGGRFNLTLRRVTAPPPSGQKGELTAADRVSI